MKPIIQPGQKIRAEKMPNDSFYKKAEGIATHVKNGYVFFQATNVMSKWSGDFRQHPTSCATAAKIENVVLID